MQKVPESRPAPDPGTLRMLVAEFEAGKNLVDEGKVLIEEGKQKILLCIRGIDKVLKYYPDMPDEQVLEFTGKKAEYEKFLAILSGSEFHVPDLTSLIGPIKE